MPKKAVPLLIVALIALLVTGCGGAGSVAPLDVVPQRANMLVYVDLSQAAQAEEDLSQYAGLLPVGSGTASQWIEILKDLEEALLFADVSDTSMEDGYAGILVKGSFDDEELIAEVESTAEKVLTTVDFKGQTIYTDSTEDFGIAVLSGDVFVMGQMQPVRDAISVREGDQSAIGGKLLDIYEGLDEAQVKLAWVVPPGLMAEGLGDVAGQMPVQMPGLEGLADLETLGITLDEQDGVTSLLVRLCFTSADSAEGIANLVETLAMMASMMGELPESVEDLLASIEVVQSGSCVTVSVDFTEAQLEELMQVLMGSMMQGAGSIPGGFE